MYHPSPILEILGQGACALCFCQVLQFWSALSTGLPTRQSPAQKTGTSVLAQEISEGAAHPTRWYDGPVRPRSRSVARWPAKCCCASPSGGHALERWRNLAYELYESPSFELVHYLPDKGWRTVVSKNHFNIPTIPRMEKWIHMAIWGWGENWTGQPCPTCDVSRDLWIQSFPTCLDRWYPLHSEHPGQTRRQCVGAQDLLNHWPMVEPFPKPWLWKHHPK